MKGNKMPNQKPKTKNQKKTTSQIDIKPIIGIAMILFSACLFFYMTKSVYCSISKWAHPHQDGFDNLIKQVFSATMVVASSFTLEIIATISGISLLRKKKFSAELAVLLGIFGLLVIYSYFLFANFPNINI